MLLNNLYKSCNMNLKEVTNQKILIIGIGWLGLPLALKLKSIGFDVYGTTTTHDKEISLLKNYQLKTQTFELPNKFLTASNSFINFNEMDTIILNTPPQKHQFPDRYIIEEFLSWVKNDLHFKGKIIFISSTSVYGQTQGAVDENSPAIPESIGGHELLLAEKYIQQNFSTYTIIRPGGLIGGMRHPIKFLQGRTNIPHANSHLHLVFRDDLIELIIKSIKLDDPKIINAFSPYNDSKKHYYVKMAQKFSMQPPSYQEFEDASLKYTKIDSGLFEKILGRNARSPEDFEFENELLT